jgi:hypothetical protein
MADLLVGLDKLNHVLDHILSHPTEFDNQRSA